MAIAGNSKLVAAGRVHTRKKIVHLRMNNGGQQYKVVLAISVSPRYCDDSGQRAWGLDQRPAIVAPECVLTFQSDKKVETLV